MDKDSNLLSIVYERLLLFLEESPFYNKINKSIWLTTDVRVHKLITIVIWAQSFLRKQMFFFVLC
jgi:hypothetical protein